MNNIYNTRIKFRRFWDKELCQSFQPKSVTSALARVMRGRVAKNIPWGPIVYQVL